MSLTGKVALVTGASGGIGRGFALQLAEAGATVYITGRTKEADPNRPGRSLDEVAELCRKRGGQVVAIKCDHSVEAEIVRLFDLIEMNENRLDILVNQCFPGKSVIQDHTGDYFWEWPIDSFTKMAGIGLTAHYVASVLGARIMVRQGSGLIVNTTDGYQGKPKEDGSEPEHVFFGATYCMVKAAIDRMTVTTAKDLRPRNVAVVGLDPGVTLTDHVKTLKYKVDTGDHEESERGLIDLLRPIFATNQSFSVETAGRSVVALATDKEVMKQTGRIWHNGQLAALYKFPID